MSRRVAAVLTLLLPGLLATRAAAQQAHRPGWWLEAAGGYGYLRVGTASNEVQRAEGTSYFVRGGRQLAHNVSLGLEYTSFRGDKNSASAYVDGIEAIAVFNPWSKVPFFFSGGVGISDGRVTVSIPTNQLFVAQGTGVGLSFSAAYDIRIGRHFAITPSVQSHIGALGDFHFSPTQIADDVIATAYQVGVGITWR
jgi:hypothetical protein